MKNPFCRGCIAILFCLSLGAVFAETNEPTLVLEIPDADALPVPLDPAFPVQILPNGDLTARAAEGFSCSDNGESCPACPTCNDVEVSMTNANQGSFSVSPSTVTQGANISFDWNSRGAWECSGSDLPGSSWDDFVGLPRGPSADISTSDIEPGTYNPKITCCNGPNCADRTTTLTVNEPSGGNGPDGCENRPRPSGVQAASQCIWGPTSPNLNVDCTSWTSFFGTAFPGNTVGTRFFQNPGEYVALEFNTGNYTGSRTGRFSLAEPQFGNPTFPPGPVIATISRCPGDFDRDAIIADSEAACYASPNPVTGSVQLPRWSTEGYTGGVGNPSGFCALQPNETYFLNIMFTQSPAGTAPNNLQWSCNGSQTRCGFLIQVQAD